jgi:tRNA (cmo5U34)-methyltransferase
MAPTQEYEDLRFAEKKRLFAAQKLSGDLYHFDTPCTVENQIKILRKSGFTSVTKVWERKNFAVLKADK